MSGLVSKESMFKNLNLPSQETWEERDTDKFVKAINDTFEIYTSMKDRLGLMVLFLNIDKLKPIVDLVIEYYNNSKNSEINFDSITTALKQLNETSEMPFKKSGGDGDGNDTHIKRIIMMLMMLIGEIILLVCISNSLKGKVDDSIALNAFNEIKEFQSCQHKNELAPPIQFVREKLQGYSVYDNSVLETAISVWECYNTDNVYESALELVFPKEDMETGNGEHAKKYLALPMSGDEISYKDNILVPYEAFKDTDNQKDRYDKIIELLDNIVKTPKKANINTSQEVNINTVVNWFGEKILKLGGEALESLKDGKINPLFWDDSMIRIKAYAKMKKQALEASVNKGVITMESAIEEVRSIFWHIGIIYFFSTRVFYKSIILYQYIKTLYNQEDNLLEDNDNKDDIRNDAAEGLLALSSKNKTEGGKSKKNKTEKNKGGKSKKNKRGKSKKNKGGKSKKNKTKKN